MKSLIYNLRNNKVLKNIIYWFIVVFLFFYTFSIPAFSGISSLNIISYFCMAALSGFTVLYTFIYSKFILNKLLIIPAAFVLFAFIGTALYSHSFIGTSGRIGWSTLFLMLITFIVFYYAFIAIDNKKIILMTLIFAFLFFAFDFAFYYRDDIIHLRLSSERIEVYFDNQNAIGFYFSIAYILSLFVALFSKKRLCLLFLIPAFIFVFLGFFTGSRAFLICVIIGTVVIAYLKLRNHKIVFAITLLALIGLFIILINIPQLAFLKDQFDRTIYTIFGIGNSKVDTSTVQRTVWPGYAFYLGGKNLLFGYGINGFMIFSGIGTYAHNNFAEIICDFGLIGFILFNLCFLIPLLLSFRAKQNELYLVPILFFMFLVRSIFGVVYYAKETYLVLALLFFLTKDCKPPKFRKAFRSSMTSDYCEVRI